MPTPSSGPRSQAYGGGRSELPIMSVIVSHAGDSLGDPGNLLAKSNKPHPPAPESDTLRGQEVHIC